MRLGSQSDSLTVRLVGSLFLMVIVLQIVLLALLLVGGREMMSTLGSRCQLVWQEAWNIGGTATIPLFICLVVLVLSVILLGLDRAGRVTLSVRALAWSNRGLRYTGRIAWLLGLLQTLLSLYQVRAVFGAELPYETMVAQLGDIAGSAYGSSLVGGGALLLGWIAQVILTGRLHD